MNKLIGRIVNALHVLGFQGTLSLCLTNIKIYILRKIKCTSYSQLFEDYFLNDFLHRKKMGFYIDIGANDPNHLSNTKYFYNNGWMGINIEPNVELYQAFMTERPRDINLNLGIGPDESMLSFYNFDENVYSTFSREEADRRVRNGHKLIGEKKVKVDRLENILSKFLPEGRNIDFMSVDTEGFDLICLRTNNWKKFRPKYVCIETIDFGNTRVNKNNEIEKFLESVSYREVFFNGINSIYKDIQ